MNRDPDPDVAQMIHLTQMCQEFHALPDPGGLMQQDSYKIYCMSLVLEAQRERQELEAKKQEARRGTRH